MYISGWNDEIFFLVTFAYFVCKHINKGLKMTWKCIWKWCWLPWDWITDFKICGAIGRLKKSPQNPCLSMSLCVFFQFFLTASGSNALQEIIHFKKQYLCMDIGPLPFIVIFFLFLWPSQNVWTLCLILCTIHLFFVINSTWNVIHSNISLFNKSLALIVS